MPIRLSAAPQPDFPDLLVIFGRAANMPFPTFVMLSLIVGGVSFKLAIDPEESLLARSDNMFWTQNAVIVPLVTGAGRGGTHSVARFLNQVGIKAQHEGIAPNAVSVSWLYAPFGDKPHSKHDLSTPFSNIQIRRNALLKEWLPHLSEASEEVDPEPFSPFTLRQNETEDVMIKFYPILHIVRNPLEAIASLERCFCGRGDIKLGSSADHLSWEFAEQFVEPLGATRMQKAANYWLRWNELSGRHATHTFRVEDIDAAQFVRALGSEQTTVAREFQSVRSGESPAELKRGLTWAQLRDAVGANLTDEIMQQAVLFGYKVD